MAPPSGWLLRVWGLLLRRTDWVCGLQFGFRSNDSKTRYGENEMRPTAALTRHSGGCFGFALQAQGLHLTLIVEKDPF